VTQRSSRRRRDAHKICPPLSSARVTTAAAAQPGVLPVSGSPFLPFVWSDEGASTHTPFVIIGDAAQLLQVTLAPGASVTCEPGALAFCSEHVSISTALEGGLFKSLSRAVAGESIFTNTLTNTARRGGRSCCQAAPCALSPALSDARCRAGAATANCHRRRPRPGLSRFTRAPRTPRLCRWTCGRWAALCSANATLFWHRWATFRCPQSSPSASALASSAARASCCSGCPAAASPSSPQQARAVLARPQTRRLTRAHGRWLRPGRHAGAAHAGARRGGAGGRWLPGGAVAERGLLCAVRGQRAARAFRWRGRLHGAPERRRPRRPGHAAERARARHGARRRRCRARQRRTQARLLRGTPHTLRGRSRATRGARRGGGASASVLCTLALFVVMAILVLLLALTADDNQPQQHAQQRRAWNVDL
jgi:hypothetical protein